MCAIDDWVPAGHPAIGDRVSVGHPVIGNPVTNDPKKESGLNPFSIFFNIYFLSKDCNKAI